MIEPADTAAGCEARERFSDGRNCAQSVIGALSGGTGMPDAPESLGAGFTGGIGHSGCVCGALAGGVAMLGEHAKAAGLEPMATRLLAEELSAELHLRFKEQHGATCCRVIKRGQRPGSDEWLSGCADITEWTTATVSELVAARSIAEKRSRRALADWLSLARRVAADLLAAGAFALAAAAAAPAQVRETVLPVSFVVLAVVGAFLEVRGSSGRRGARVMRVVGGIAAAGLMLAVLRAPVTALDRIALLLASGSPGVVAAKVAVSLAGLVVVSSAVSGLKRYR